MPTILDVAAKAGVGVGTVSRVLNDNVHVSDATRTKVKAAIAELGYRPSSIARALSSGKTYALPIFATNITLPSVTARIRGVLDVVDEAHEVVACQVRVPEKRLEFVERHAVRLPAFGVLTIALDLEPAEIAAFRTSKVPVVSIDHLIAGIPSLVIDDTDAMNRAMQHLLALGHTEIGFIGDAETGDYRTRASAERRRAYRAALTAAGIGWTQAHEVEVTNSKRAAAAQLLSRSQRPMAVVADADSTALCVMATARSLGIKVPHDLSVIGFDDVWAADAAGLTTVAQPLEESGRLAARMLFAAAQGEEVPLVTTLPTQLIERETTAPPPTR
jgi:DNA-binding LacI/PurR family transcriptional regulator